MQDPSRRAELNDWLALKLRPTFEGRFQVAMDDAARMRRRETGAQLARDLQRFIGGPPANPLQRRMS